VLYNFSLHLFLKYTAFQKSDKILSEILVNYAFGGRSLIVVLLTSLNTIPIYQDLSYYILFFHDSRDVGLVDVSISHLVRNATVGRTPLD
jgi:hypothetical protein